MYKYIQPKRKALDRQSLFSVVRKQGPISKKELSIEFNVSITTISRLLHEMIEEGLIRQELHGDSIGGRKPALFSVDGSRFVSYGISISRDRLEMILMNLNGQILRESNYWYDDLTDAQRIIDEVSLFISEKLEPGLVIMGAGISTFGPLDRRNGIILSPKHANIREWRNVPICQLISRKTGMPVVLENHTRALALGEQWYGAGKGSTSVAHIHVDYGIGASTSAGPELLDGDCDLTGVMGNMIIDLHSALKEENSINQGTLEDYSSVEAIIRKTKEKKKNEIISSDGKTKEEKSIDFRDIVEAYQNNDPVVREIVDKAASIFGIGLANYLSIIRSDVIILGGETIESLPAFYDIAIAAAKKFLARDGITNSFFQKTSFPRKSNCIGAATLLFEINFQE